MRMEGAVVPAVCGLVLGVASLAMAFVGGGELAVVGLGVAGAGQLGLSVWTLLLARQRAERVDRLLETSRRILGGEAHLYVPVAGADELARLAEGMNRFVDVLRGDHLEAESGRLLSEAMVRETPNGLMIIDERGRIRSCNPAFRRMLPTAEDPIGKSPAELYRIPELIDAIEESARTRAVAERSATVGNRDLLLRGIPLADGAGCMAAVLDITSVRLAERARRDFVANVSHELRTPVTALVGYAEALLEDRQVLPAGMAPMAEAIARNAQRLHLLVDDVLQLSKIEARQGDLPLEREALAPLVHDVVERLLVVARQAGVALLVDIPPELEAEVNPAAFDHALGNLIDNAIKYGRAGERVEIQARAEGKSVIVRVTDHGPGIAPEHQPRIFERFYRGDPARSRIIPGTGLGLALVKHLCLAMRAEVRFESAPGEGSRFELVLPA